MERFAVKIISKKKFTLRGQHQINQTEAVANEVNVLRALDHVRPPLGRHRHELLGVTYTLGNAIELRLVQQKFSFYI